MIPHPHSENLEKKRKEHTNTNIAYTIINTLDTSVVNTITVVTKTIIAITNIISTIVVSDNTKLTSNDNNMNSSIIKDNSITQVNRCKDIRIHKTEDTIKILS